MVIEIHNDPIYVVSILTQHAILVDWHEVLCTTHIDRAIAKGNMWLDKGIEVNIKSWITEMDFESCTIGKENRIFIGDDDIITWKEKENK